MKKFFIECKYNEKKSYLLNHSHWGWVFTSLLEDAYLFESEREAVTKANSMQLVDWEVREW